MGNLISLIMAADSPVLIVILSIALVYLFVKAVYESGKWILDRLNGYHGIKTKEEKKEEQIQDRLAVLEKHDRGQHSTLNELGDELKKLIDMVQKVQDTQAKMIIDTYKGTIFRIYHDAQKNGYISQTELDRFIEIVRIYREHGGDGVVDEKIYPEILSLKIIDK